MKHIKRFLFISFLLVLACTKEPETIPVSAVTIGQDTAEMTEGETIQLKATVSPSNATNKTVTWSSSNPSVAAVSNDGTVTAVKEGTATIYVMAESKKAQCSVTVKAKYIKVSSITLDMTEAVVKVGGTLKITATVKPDNATDKTVKWSSSDEKIATVKDGVVTALAAGNIIITGKAEDVSADCKISVEAIEVTSVELDKTEVTLKANETVTLSATVKPDDATEKTVTWLSSDETVAKVENGTVTAIKVGTATITAKAGDKSADCKIIVAPTPVESVELSKTSVELKAGQNVTISATVKPDDATDKTVTWSSSDETVAKVENGIITAVNVGSATITAKAGDKSASCAVTVAPTPVESIELNKTSVEMKVGQNVTITATVKPDDATDKAVSWTSSDSSIASVEEGKITAKKVGQVTVIAKAGEKTATCIVTVEATPVESVFLNKSSLELVVGKSETLVATVSPSTATIKTVFWSSDDSTVASVDENGKVTAKKKGTAHITVTTTDGEKSASCEISVRGTTGSNDDINEEDYEW